MRMAADLGYPETGALKAIGRYPTGKGANWVEIVAFD